MDTIIDVKAVVELVKVLLCSYHLVSPKYKVPAIHTALHIKLKAFRKNFINYIINVNSLNMEEIQGDSET